MNVDSVVAKLTAIPANVRIAGVGLIAALVVVSIVLTLASHGAPSALFARPLDSAQLSEVEALLAQWNVPFTPTTDNVSVDARRRNELLLRLSLAGVPHGHVATTSEALSNVGVLTPQSIIDAQTRNGLSGEIELALRSVEGVEDASVIIAPAQVAEFADQSAHEGSASVRLRLKPGARLSRTAINGIRSFVAASIAGLDRNRVTILDDRGLALGDASSANDDPAQLERSLQSALDDVLGAGVAVVRVHAEYSTVETERRDSRRAPLGDAITRSVQNEAYQGAGRVYHKDEEHDDRGSDTNEVVSRAPAGAISRINTAVFLDETHAANIASVRELAAASVGFDPRRGDTLSVQAMDFHRSAAPRHDLWYLAYGVLTPLLPTVAVLVALIVFMRAGLPYITDVAKSCIERHSVAQTSKIVAGYAPAQVRGALAHEPPHAAAAIISALPAATAAAVLELYPPHEREAIVARMQRAHSPHVPGLEEMFGRHA